MVELMIYGALLSLVLSIAIPVISPLLALSTTEYNRLGHEATLFFEQLMREVHQSNAYMADGDQLFLEIDDATIVYEAHDGIGGLGIQRRIDGVSGASKMLPFLNEVVFTPQSERLFTVSLTLSIESTVYEEVRWMELKIDASS